MSLPPSTVRISRKRNAEVVDLLHLQVHGDKGTKRTRTDNYVYVRDRRSNSSDNAAPATNPIRQSNSAPLLSNLGPHGISTHSPFGAYSGASTPGDATPPLPTGAATPLPVLPKPPKIASLPRRFHISRSETSSTSIPSSLGKRGPSEVVFKERKAVRREKDTDAITSSPRPCSPEQVRPQKKPGLTKYPNVVPRPTSPQKPQQDLPNPLRSFSGMPYSDELAAQMQAYTLQEIGKSLAASETERPTSRDAVSTRIHSSIPSKFKPKKPALRYAERHPELKNADDMEVDHDIEWEEEAGDDSDFVIDTYIRMPVEALESATALTNFGLLVLDSQPDIDEFYRGETESDDEEEDDEEDENAEDHYTADYPEDEVASDDEFDRNAYHYTKDVDEFEDDEAFSDDENDATRYPWSKKPWMNRTSGLGGEEDDEDDGDRIKVHDH